MNKKFVIFLCLFAGIMDSVTGFLLMLVPQTTLQLMQITIVYEDWIFIRFVGAFVFAVGSMYLFGLQAVRTKGDWTELRAIWKYTAWIRIVACVFLTAALANGSLDIGWIGVPLTDGLLGGVQMYWMVSSRFPVEKAHG